MVEDMLKTVRTSRRRRRNGMCQGKAWTMFLWKDYENSSESWI